MSAICKQCQRTYIRQQAPTVVGTKPPFDPPAYCDECSTMRRLSWLNQYCLYNRPCDQCMTDTIGMYRVGSNYQVFCARCWQDRSIVSLTYDPNQPFLVQFAELLNKQPLPALWSDNNILSSNCAYTNNLLSSKNCYFVFDGNKDEDCYYSFALSESINSADCSYCIGSELSYELVNCHGCYHSAYLIDSRLATECYFCYDLSNCTNCLFSSGLRNKHYYIFNKPYTKEDYENYVKDHLKKSSYIRSQQLVKQYTEWLKSVIRKESTNRKSENCIGNDILYSKNAAGFFMYHCEDCSNIINATTSKNCNNCFQVGYCELSSEFLALENSYTSFASAYCENARNNFYSLYCKNCTNVFGCIGLQNQEYCILNKQYSKETYELLTQQIIEQMQLDSSFGQFSPPSLSPFTYEETVAQDIFPLDQASAVRSGYRWQGATPPLASVPVLIDDDINDISITITKTPLTCESCSKQYRITEQELALYQKIQVPIPHHCFKCRHQARRLRRPNFRMQQRNCTKCQKAIITHYSPIDADQVYCHDCYETTILVN